MILCTKRATILTFIALEGAQGTCPPHYATAHETHWMPTTLLMEDNLGMGQWHSQDFSIGGQSGLRQLSMGRG